MGVGVGVGVGGCGCLFVLVYVWSERCVCIVKKIIMCGFVGG